MGKRVTITKHDFELIEWLVEYYRENGVFIKFPAHQNLDELLEKLEPPKPSPLLDGESHG
jgi:hypothetical protein